MPPSTSSIAKTLTAASVVPTPLGSSREEQLELSLQNALAARDAAMFELSDVLRHNVSLLNKLREKTGQDVPIPHQTYAEDLLHRRQAIALHTGAYEPNELLMGSPRASSSSADPLGNEFDMLTKAVGLSLDRLRELRWKELLLQADISGESSASWSS